MNLGPKPDEEHEKLSKFCNISAIELESFSGYLDRYSMLFFQLFLIPKVVGPDITAFFDEWFAVRPDFRRMSPQRKQRVIVY